MPDPEEPSDQVVARDAPPTAAPPQVGPLDGERAVGRRTQEQRRSETEVRVLDAALSLIALRGSHALTLVEWTLVRPGRLLDEAPTGSYRIEDGANPVRGVAVPRGDVAAFVVGCAAGPGWSRQHPTITV